MQTKWTQDSLLDVDEQTLEQALPRIRKGVRVMVLIDGHLAYRGTVIRAMENRLYTGAPIQWNIELDDDNFGPVSAKYADFPNGIEVQPE